MPASNQNLIHAKTSKNDEYYTRYSDVYVQVHSVKKYLSGKKIYCNCDDPLISSFWDCLHRSFSELDLRSLTATCLHHPFIYHYMGGADIETDKCRFLPITDGPWEDGDCFSQPCQELLQGCDILITNPPFSRAEELLLQTVEYGKDFLLVADLNLLTHKKVFPLLADRKIYVGTQIKKFIKPDGTIASFGNKIWIASFPLPKSASLPLSVKYKESAYNKYLNADVLDIPKLSQIPVDYKGVMAVPITFLLYDVPEFDVIGVNCNALSGEVHFFPIGQKWISLFFSQGHTGHYTPKMRNAVYIDKEGNAKAAYSKLLIRKKTGYA